MKASVEATHGQRATLSSTRARERYRHGRGFTLIELLVVMAVIAVMAALMLPALSKAKRQISASSCLNNQKQMAYAFHMYAQDNSDRVVQMADYVTGDLIWPAGGFWGGPAAAPDTWTSSRNALSAVQTGLASSNALYFYCTAVQSYHCPSDFRMLNNPNVLSPTVLSPTGWGYDSYARSQNIGGQPINNYWGAGATYTKLSVVSLPGTTSAMVEDADWRGYNVGTWAVTWAGDSFAWQSPLALWHGSVSSIAFADSHAELHRWTDPGIVGAGQDDAQGRVDTNWQLPTNGVDYFFVFRGYQFPGHP